MAAIRACLACDCRRRRCRLGPTLAMDFAISQESMTACRQSWTSCTGLIRPFVRSHIRADKARVTGFVNRNNYRVEFLTSNGGSDEYTGRPLAHACLGGASVENLRFLDYLIYEPVRTCCCIGKA